MGDAFPDVETSYRRWEDRHGQGRGDLQTATGSPALVSNQQFRRAQSQSPAPRGRRMFPRGGRASGADVGGEAMARNPSSGSGSGGIMLADGRVVGFGEGRSGDGDEQLRSRSEESGEDGGLGLGIREG